MTSFQVDFVEHVSQVTFFIIIYASKSLMDAHHTTQPMVYVLSARIFMFFKIIIAIKLSITAEFITLTVPAENASQITSFKITYAI